MKYLILLAPFALAACAGQPPTCGLPNEPVVIGYAKDGLAYYDDQAPLSAPCPTVTPPNVSPPPVVEPPEKVKCNSGRGNGSEGSPDCDPGNSSGRNNGGD